MSLRRQLIALFAALAVVPLLLVGLLDYIRSIRALQDVVASNTAVIAEQAAAELQQRFNAPAANLALLAENTAAVTILDGATRAKRPPDDTSLAYLRRLRDVTRKQFAWIVYRDSASNAIVSFDDDAVSGGYSDDLYVASVPVRDAHGGTVGRVDAAIRMDSIYPRSALDVRFGRGGRTAVFDRFRKTLLFAGAGARSLPSLSDLSPAGDTAGPVRRLSYERGDTSYIASMVFVAQTPFAVLSLGDVAEFSGPFGRIRGSNLLIVVLMTAVVAVLFLLALWRATRALSELTVAADEVGRGNFAPQLPPRGATEVGKLAAAFSLMVARLRDTLAEVERSRKLAVIGEFASQVSHEIRNPLTSIKLNLQELERGASTGGIRSDLVQPVEISLREVNRLDRVVRGVLQLGRGRVSGSTSFALHDAASAAAESMRLGLEQSGIALLIERRGNGSCVRGDRSLVEAAFLNILRNASEAMPGGGAIRVVSDDATVNGRLMNRVLIEDRGPGVPVADRERIFSPFYTTKPEGSGLGLALAHRTIEEHQGRLWVDEPEHGGPGAAFIVELPVAADA